MSVARMMQMAAAGSAGAGPEPSGWIDPDLANASYDGVSLDVSAEDTLPRNVFFKPDGLSLFMVGDNGADVNEYTLSSAWDITTASYTQNFSVSSQGVSPHGLFFKPDGTKFYTTDYGNDSVYEYSLSSAWNISTASYVQVFDVSTYEAGPAGLFFKPDGTKMYHVGFLGDEVNEYTLSTPWDISSASHIQAFSLSSQDTGPIALYFNPNGDKMWVSGNGTNFVYEYTLSTPWDISSAGYSSVSFSVASQVGSGTSSLFFKSDGSKMYVSGSGTDTIYQYSTAAAAPAEWTEPDLANASYDSVNFSAASQTTNPQDVSFKPDGTKMYVVGYSGQDVSEYALSSAWDITTASYTQNFSVALQVSGPMSCFFSPDGTKMYILDFIGDDVTEYNLSTAWDISSASYVQDFSVATQEDQPLSMFFKPDGTKMYVSGGTGDDVNEYALSTAWDVSTASFSHAFSMAAQVGSSQGIFFSPNGDRFFVIDGTGDDVNEYALSTAWDVSSGSYVQNFSVAAQETQPSGIFFKSDGSKMYVVGTANDTIYQYSTA